MACGKPCSSIILLSTISCATLLTTFNWHFDATGHSWIDSLRSNVSFERILDTFTILTTAHANQYSDECFMDASKVFDSRGRACIDFDFAAKRQGIYAVNKTEVAYVYCSIPKNGCTYHLGLMQRLLGFGYQGGGFVHGKTNKTRLQIPGDVLTQMMLDPKVPKYFVVRNPLERALSAYLDKVERLLPEEEKTPESFEKWVYDEVHPGMEQERGVNPHWKPQISFCGFGMRDLWREFRWFKVEEPVEYVDYLERILPEHVLKDGWNGSSNASFRDAVLGPRKRTGHTSELFFKYVRSLRLFDYLVYCYSLDIDGLGYRDEVDEMRERVVEQISKRDV